MNTKAEDIDLREAQAGDAEAIAVLHAESWRRTYRGMMTDEFLDTRALSHRLDVWRQRLSQPQRNQHVNIAVHERELVGLICALAGDDPVWGSLIDALHVRASHHGRGVGRLLMQRVGVWLAEVAPQQGAYLWVMEGNIAARRFYEHLGARNAGTVDQADPDGGRAPHCRYVWTASHRPLWS